MHATINDNVRSQHKIMLPHNYCSYELQRFECNLWCFLDDYYSLHAEVLLKKIIINKANNSKLRMRWILCNWNPDWNFKSLWLALSSWTTRDFEISSPKEREIDDNHLKEIKDQMAINKRHVKVEKQRKK